MKGEPTPGLQRFLMLIKRPADIPSSEITDKKVYLNRREFIRSGGGHGRGRGRRPRRPNGVLAAQQPADHGRKLVTTKSPLSTTETPNTWEHITTYNNYYEFGTDKGEPAIYARAFKAPEPWTVTVEGECAKKGPMNLEDILKGVTLEDRIYRHRCVEAWSMVIPWVGFPLGDFIKKLRADVEGEVRRVHDAVSIRGRCRARSQPVLHWPYVEGLRMDEAMHPLTILAVGLYGEVLPNQNGAPLRLVTPWKYGFKGVKSIVKIRFVEKQPLNTWQRTAPQRVRLLRQREPEGRSSALEPGHASAGCRASFQNHKTEMFNGYGDQVASLYTGLDLRKNF